MDYKDLLEHHNPYHDRFGRFTWASGAAASISRTADNKQRLKYEKALAKEKESELRLKNNRKIARAKRKAMKAEAKAKVREYKQKAAIAKGKTKVDKTFELTEEVKGKTAEERIKNRDALRKTKKFEIQEAIESGNPRAIKKYSNIMTTQEINSAINSLNAKEQAANMAINRGQKQVDKWLKRAEFVSSTAARIRNMQEEGERWKRKAEAQELREKFDAAYEGNEEAIKFLEERKKKIEFEKSYAPNNSNEQKKKS